MNSEACAVAEFALHADDAKLALREMSAANGMGPGVTVDSSSGLRTLTLSGGDAREGAVLDLSVEVSS